MNFTFRDTCSKKLRIKVPSTGNFGEVLKAFADIRYPPTGVAAEQITFIIMELLSNAIRAHKERGTAEPVITEFLSDGKTMQIVISDHGGGFDPARLPYSFNDNVQSIDIMSDAFGAYRELHNNSRFGMGLIATRKVFPVFKLAFVDEEANEYSWPSEKIVGTVITLGMPICAEGASA